MVTDYTVQDRKILTGTTNMDAAFSSLTNNYSYSLQFYERVDRFLLFFLLSHCSTSVFLSFVPSVALLMCLEGSWADRTALHEAASHGRALQLMQLIESGASVNMVTVDNITPLHEACIQAHPNCARLLLEAGAQVSLGFLYQYKDTSSVSNTENC